MEIKVSNIKTHTYPSKKPYQLGVPLTCPVVEAKLVLIRPTKEDYQGHSPLKGFICKPSSKNEWFKSILISETEQMEKGDVVYHPTNGIGKCDYPDHLIDGCLKILALPEHFSTEQLNMIVDGKLKDGDKMYVECEAKRPFIPPNKGFDHFWAIKSPLSIYPIEEKLYTIVQLEESFDAGVQHGLDLGQNGVNTHIPNFKEWLKTIK